MDAARRYTVLWMLRMIHGAVMRLRSGPLYEDQEHGLQKIQHSLEGLIDRAETRAP